MKVSDEQYTILYTFRYALRHFMRWSQEQAALVGLTEQQHQLLLAVRAHQGTVGPSISEMAESLLIRHHSAVELIRRVEKLGMLSRTADPQDQRVVRLILTSKGQDILDSLTDAHLKELERAATTLHISEEFLNRLSEDFIGNASNLTA